MPSRHTTKQPIEPAVMEENEASEFLEEVVVGPFVELPSDLNTPTLYVVDGIPGQYLEFYTEGKLKFKVPCGIPITLTEEQVVFLKQTNKI